MNKFCIDGILVVEGRSDQAKISSFLSSPIIVTNGFDVNDKLIDFLKAASEKHKIYLFLDSDESGVKIEAKLLKNVKNTVVLKLKTNNYTKKNKRGNAEIPYPELYNYFLNFKSDNYYFQNTISPMMISILKSQNLMNFNNLVSRYPLIDGSNKYISLQLNILGIKEEEIQKDGN